MPISTDIDRIASAAGIEAVAVHRPMHDVQFRGKPEMQQVLTSAFDLYRVAEETLGNKGIVRVYFGQCTISVQPSSNGEEWIAVVVPTGHSIAKSLRRLISRASKGKRSHYQQWSESRAKVADPQQASTPAAADHPRDPQPST